MMVPGVLVLQFLEPGGSHFCREINPPGLRLLRAFCCALLILLCNPASAYIRAPNGLLVGTEVNCSSPPQPPSEKLPFMNPLMFLTTPVRVQEGELRRA
ncbi:MAG: hypothetical protein UY93_C0006G0007 [Parcubacteria group bacterium GW2011_GWA1_56_13]|nr:MAG: hypothetical protein UY93_C0006G0007 [Parcubacteria group bacterium GW2011_GWA1_56_13]